jgi:hypothetical protein
MRETNVRFGTEIASYGASIKGRAEGIEIPGMIVLMELSPQKREEEVKEIAEVLGSFLPRKAFVNVIRHPAFFALLEQWNVLHELVHRGAYPEEGVPAERLEHIDDNLCEAKSDVISAASMASLNRRFARQHFGDQWLEAINLALVYGILRTLRYSPKESEAFPYWLSAILMLNVLAQRGAFSKTKTQRGAKRIRLNAEFLTQDHSSVFENIGHHILEVYEMAATAEGDMEKVAAARERGSRIARTIPLPIIRNIEHLLQQGE